MDLSNPVSKRVWRFFKPAVFMGRHYLVAIGASDITDIQRPGEFVAWG